MKINFNSCKISITSCKINQSILSRLTGLHTVESNLNWFHAEHSVLAWANEGLSVVPPRWGNEKRNLVLAICPRIDEGLKLEMTARRVFTMAI